MAQPQPQPRRRRRRLGLARAAKDAKLAARFVTPARFVRRRRRSAASVLPSPPPLRAALRRRAASEEMRLSRVLFSDSPPRPPTQADVGDRNRGSVRRRGVRRALFQDAPSSPPQRPPPNTGGGSPLATGARTGGLAFAPRLDRVLRLLPPAWLPDSLARLQLKRGAADAAEGATAAKRTRRASA